MAQNPKRRQRSIETIILQQKNYLKETNGKSQKWKIAITIIMAFFVMEFQNLFNNSIKVLKSLLKRESCYCFIVLFVFFSSGVFFSATLISLGTNQLGCTGLGTKDRSDKWCSIILKCWEYHLVVLSEPEVEAPGWPSSSAEAPCARGKLPETGKWESGQLRNSMGKRPED